MVMILTESIVPSKIVIYFLKKTDASDSFICPSIEKVLNQKIG